MNGNDKTKQIRQLREELTLFRPLNISRVPVNAYNEFVEFAYKEFADDYGMCLKAIFDNFKRAEQLEKLLFNFNVKFKKLEEKIEELEKGE